MKHKRLRWHRCLVRKLHALIFQLCLNPMRWQLMRHDWRDQVHTWSDSLTCSPRHGVVTSLIFDPGLVLRLSKIKKYMMHEKDILSSISHELILSIGCHFNTIVFNFVPLVRLTYKLRNPHTCHFSFAFCWVLLWVNLFLHFFPPG